MNQVSRSLSLVAAMVAATACATPDSASPPRLDHLEGAAGPTFQPMLVVPMPPLSGRGGATA